MAQKHITKLFVFSTLTFLFLSNCADKKIERIHEVNATIYHKCDSGGYNYTGTDVYAYLEGDDKEILQLGGHNAEGDLAINLVGKHTVADYTMDASTVNNGWLIYIPDVNNDKVQYASFGPGLIKVTKLETSTSDLGSVSFDQFRVVINQVPVVYEGDTLCISGVIKDILED